MSLKVDFNTTIRKNLRKNPISITHRCWEYGA